MARVSSRRLRIASALASLLVTACGIGVVGVESASEGTEPTSADGGGGTPVASPDAALDDGGDVPLDATLLRDAETDAAEDAVVMDAPADGGCPPGSWRCAANHACVTSCAACDGAPIACADGRRCAGSCAACADRSFECWPCAVGGSALPPRCERGSKDCYVGGAVHCGDCKKQGCAGREQTCFHVGGASYECRGCGEPGTNGASCAGGGQCNAAASQCP